MSEEDPLPEGLLERCRAALRYYQQFIDQHQGDPSGRCEPARVQTRLDVSSTRATRNLGALTAQQDYFLLMLQAMLLEDKGVPRNSELGTRNSELGTKKKSVPSSEFRVPSSDDVQENAEKNGDVEGAMLC